MLTYGKRESVAKRLFSAFINPFTAILLALAVISAVTDIALASPGEKNCATVLIIATMVLLSGGLRFAQETRSGNVADKLLGMLPEEMAGAYRPRFREEDPQVKVLGKAADKLAAYRAAQALIAKAGIAPGLRARFICLGSQSSTTFKMLAAWARVVLPWGSMVPLSWPLIRPLPLAQLRAVSAQSLMAPASGNWARSPPAVKS